MFNFQNPLSFNRYCSRHLLLSELKIDLAIVFNVEVSEMHTVLIREMSLTLTEMNMLITESIVLSMHSDK